MIELVIVYHPVGDVACQKDFLKFFRMSFYEIRELELPTGVVKEARIVNSMFAEKSVFIAYST